MTVLRLEAPAKVNLWLKITGKRADGYHELVTLFHALDWCDELHAERTSGDFELELQPAGERTVVGAGEDNLVMRAARAWRERAGVAWGVRFHLLKRLPAGAGLGGGSSDAATALLLLDSLADAPLGLPILAEIGASLGADVPFFLAAGTQLGRGTGTDLIAVEGAPTQEFLLLLPSFGCDTPVVYGNFRPQWQDGPPDVRVPSNNPLPFKGLEVPVEPRNDLEPAALAAYPELATLIQEVSAWAPAPPLLSGSGSTLFWNAIEGAALDALGSDLQTHLGPRARLVRARSWCGNPSVSSRGMPKGACGRVPMEGTWPDPGSSNRG